MLKITRDLIQPELCYLELDGRQLCTVYAFDGCYDRIREALEEREATPEEAYLLEEQGREIATLVKRLANAEMLIERLNGSVKRGKCLFLAEHGRSDRLRCALENFIKAYYRGLIGAVPVMPPAFAFLDNPPPSPIVIRNLLMGNEGRGTSGSCCPACGGIKPYPYCDTCVNPNCQHARCQRYVRGEDIVW